MAGLSHWCGCWLLAATTNSYVFCFYVFGVQSIIWFHFLFVCVPVWTEQRKCTKKHKHEMKRKPIETDASQGRSRSLHFSQFIHFFLSRCFEIFSTECRSAKLTLCHCVCAGRHFGFTHSLGNSYFLCEFVSIRLQKEVEMLLFGSECVLEWVVKNTY